MAGERQLSDAFHHAVNRYRRLRAPPRAPARLADMPRASISMIRLPLLSVTGQALVAEQVLVDVTCAKQN